MLDKNYLMGRGRGTNHQATAKVATRRGLRPFQVLSLREDASLEEIKRAYRALAQAHHPDKGGSAQVFKLVSEAFAMIGTEEKLAALRGPSRSLSPPLEPQTETPSEPSPGTYTRSGSFVRDDLVTPNRVDTLV